MMIMLNADLGAGGNWGYEEGGEGEKKYLGIICFTFDNEFCNDDDEHVDGNDEHIDLDDEYGSVDHDYIHDNE